MLKRFVGARNLDVSDIPAYMNELDHLEDVYFGKKQAAKKEAVRLRGLFEYCYVAKPPSKLNIHVPYNLMAFLVKMAPKECLEDYVTEKLQSYGYLQKGQPLDSNLKQRVEYALNWIGDFEEIKETDVTLKPEEKKAVAELTANLETEVEPDKIQNAIFSAAKNNGVQPGSFFKILYQILMGAPQGPRLGPYVLTMGKQNVIAALKRAISKNWFFQTAGMIGYDIRNPLQAITGELFLMKQEIDTLPDSPRKVNVQESLRTLQEQIDYISKIISDLQDFARPLKPELGNVDLHAFILQLIITVQVPGNIKLSRNAKAIPQVKADSAF